jgi:hypothetical protein
VLELQPDLQSDVYNCGACYNDCYAGAVHSLWSCESGDCVFQGCDSFYYDLDGNEECDYACFFMGSEQCNGVDDNCDGQVDEDLVAPSTADICGVSPDATSPECTSDVSVLCQGGSWHCTFPAGICSPSCLDAEELCDDDLDNDCDGDLNEGC